MDKKLLGTYIKNRRKELNISMNELADSLGISFQAVHKWEKGEASPDFTILGDLCYILKINLDDLLELKTPSEEYFETRKFNYEEFGITLKKCLNHHNISQLYLSKKTGIGQSTISNIITQKSYPTIAQFITLCKFLNVSYSDLYYSTIKPTIKPKKTKKNNGIYIKLTLTALIILCFNIILITSIKKFNESKELIDDNISYVEEKETYHIEYWDEYGNLIDKEEVLEGEKLTNDLSYLSIWNKKVEKQPTSSTIYKVKKRPPYIELRINNMGSNFRFNSTEEINLFKITDGYNYCKTLLLNGLPIDVNNLTNGYYELDVILEPIKTHTITFPSELNLDHINIKDTQILYKLPIISTQDYIIYQYRADNKIIKINEPYSFEKSITATPIYHKQETIVNEEGYITYLNSDEESIIIPDTVDGIKVNGILSSAITLNEINKKIIFLNKNVISFNSVFKNEELIDNIKEIEIHYNTFTFDSSLGPITNLDRIYVKTESIPSNNYQLINISTNKFHLNKLEYYYESHNKISYRYLDVDDIYCLDSGFTHVVANMFENSTVKNFYYDKTLHEFSIGNEAFKNCKNLEKFNFYTKTVVYGVRQFKNCINLKEVTFYNEIDILSNDMFYNTKIENITINSCVDEIRKNAFANTNLKHIEIVRANYIEALYLPQSLQNFYIGGLHEKIQVMNKFPNLTIHYLDYNNSYYYTLRHSGYKICLNCTCLHKGKE